MTKRRRANLMQAVTTLRTLAPHEVWEVPALTRIHLREVATRLQWVLALTLNPLEKKP